MFYWGDKEWFKRLRRGKWPFGIPKQTEPVTVTSKRMPLMITYDDVNDRDTLRIVDPNDLAASVGEGVSLKSITIFITKDPYTQGELAKISPCFRDRTWCMLRELFTPNGPLHGFSFGSKRPPTFFEKLYQEITT